MREMSRWPEVMGAGGEPEGRPSVRMEDARSVSGIHRLPEESPWPGVTGARGKPEGCLLARLSEVRALSGLHRLREMS